MLFKMLNKTCGFQEYFWKKFILTQPDLVGSLYLQTFVLGSLHL